MQSTPVTGRSHCCSHTSTICFTENFPESWSPSLTVHCLYGALLPWWKAVYKQHCLEEIKANKLLTGAMKEPFTQIWRKLRQRHIKGWVCPCHNSTLYFTKTAKKQNWQAKYFSGIFSSSEPDGTFWFQIPRTHIDWLSIDSGMIKGKEWGRCLQLSEHQTC